jgi:hypothetical protein
MAILPTYPKFLQDLLDQLGGTVFGNRPDTPAASVAAPAPVASPGRAKIEAALQSNPNLTEDQYTQIVSWLAGGELADPALATWVRGVIGGAPVQGAGAISGAPAPAASALAGRLGTAAKAQLAAPDPATPGLPTAGGGGTPPPVAADPSAPPWATDVGGAALLEDQGARARFAGRAAGLDPETGGIASRFFQQSTAPMMGALAQFYGYLPGGDGDTDPTKFGGDLGNYAKMFVTPGQSGVRWSRDMAQQILANPEFMSQLLDVEDSDQIEQLQGLMSLLHPSVSGLKRSWLDRQSENLASRYTDSAMGLLPGSSVGQYGGRFTNFLDKDEKARAIAQRVFGYAPR